MLSQNRGAYLNGSAYAIGALINKNTFEGDGLIARALNRIITVTLFVTGGVESTFAESYLC